MDLKYVGIDLHSTNNYIGIINEENKRIYGPHLLSSILQDAYFLN